MATSGGHVLNPFPIAPLLHVIADPRLPWPAYVLHCALEHSALAFCCVDAPFSLQDFQKVLAAGMIGASMFVGGAAKAEVDYDGIKVRLCLWKWPQTLTFRNIR